MDRFPEFRLGESLSLLAVSDVINNAIALDEEELLVPQFEIQPVADPVVHQGCQPRHPIEISLSKPAILPFARRAGGGGLGTRHLINDHPSMRLGSEPASIFLERRL